MMHFIFYRVVFLLVPLKNDLVSDYIVNPIKKVLSVRVPKGLALSHFKGGQVKITTLCIHQFPYLSISI